MLDQVIKEIQASPVGTPERNAAYKKAAAHFGVNAYDKSDPDWKNKTIRYLESYNPGYRGYVVDYPQRGVAA